MDIGMLWYDDDRAGNLETKVRKAIQFYQAKYGAVPNSCFVHPSLLAPDGAARTIGATVVRPSRTVIKNHFWLGVEDATQ